MGCPRDEIRITGLVITRPSWNFQNLQWSKNSFGGTSSGVKYIQGWTLFPSSSLVTYQDNSAYKHFFSQSFTCVNSYCYWIFVILVSGLTGTEIAVIGSVAFVALVILCAGVVLFKFGACSCRRKSSNTRASNDVRMSQHIVTEV